MRGSLLYRGGGTDEASSSLSFSPDGGPSADGEAPDLEKQPSSGEALSDGSSWLSTKNVHRIAGSLSRGGLYALTRVCAPAHDVDSWTPASLADMMTLWQLAIDVQSPTFVRKRALYLLTLATPPLLILWRERESEHERGLEMPSERSVAGGTSLC